MLLDSHPSSRESSSCLSVLSSSLSGASCHCGLKGLISQEKKKIEVENPKPGQASVESRILVVRTCQKENEEGKLKKKQQQFAFHGNSLRPQLLEDFSFSLPLRHRATAQEERGGGEQDREEEEEDEGHFFFSSSSEPCCEGRQRKKEEEEEERREEEEEGRGKEGGGGGGGPGRSALSCHLKKKKKKSQEEDEEEASGDDDEDRVEEGGVDKRGVSAWVRQISKSLYRAGFLRHDHQRVSSSSSSWSSTERGRSQVGKEEEKERRTVPGVGADREDRERKTDVEAEDSTGGRRKPEKEKKREDEQSLAESSHFDEGQRSKKEKADRKGSTQGGRKDGVSESPVESCVVKGGGADEGEGMFEEERARGYTSICCTRFPYVRTPQVDHQTIDALYRLQSYPYQLAGKTRKTRTSSSSFSLSLFRRRRGKALFLPFLLLLLIPFDFKTREGTETAFASFSFCCFSFSFSAFSSCSFRRDEGREDLLFSCQGLPVSVQSREEGRAPNPHVHPVRTALRPRPRQALRKEASSPPPLLRLLSTRTAHA